MYIWSEVEFQLHCFEWGYPVFQHCWLKKLFFSTEWSWYPCQKSICIDIWVYFYIFSSILGCISIRPVLYFFDYFNCVISFEIRKSESSFFFSLHSVTSLVWLFATPWTAAFQAPLSFTISQSLLELMSIESDAIRPSQPLSPPSPLALNLSQHQGLLQWVGSLRQVAKALELQLHHQSFPWIFRVDFLFRLTGLISLKTNRFSRIFSSTIQKYQFFMVHLSHELEKLELWLYRPLSAKWCVCFLICCLGLS